MVFVFPPNKLILPVQAGSSYVPFPSNSSSFSWTFLTAYSEAKFKGNGDKAPLASDHPKLVTCYANV